MAAPQPMTFDEFWNKFKLIMIGFGAYGAHIEAKGSMNDKAHNIHEVPENARRILSQIYRELTGTDPTIPPTTIPPTKQPADVRPANSPGVKR